MPETNSSPVFTITPKPTFEAAVKIPTPEGDQTLTLVFKHKRRDQLKEYFERVAKIEDADNTDALMEIVEGWKDVDQPFTPAALHELTLNYYGATARIFDAYITALTGAKAKN